ncbi:hypothetical protein A2331_06485 [Candidatus Falkowbacteria bacterium RIFOXYB2_FULL_34_18]|uniref:Lipoprotein n=1 Tax=Candidatus Falkowbacteria bacterium RIFOXYD2_FULL_34_120 TaxID=1798007 RepID=A0A1F5TS45_9BACT|nr:MAG: hypothetical protein A2331_06485 [Candidatus Falkowbacteria bacterium RIFOXYB2_FULL_34_18]OGF29561.1 MAG: hypothetical protein A2500_01610 [Candidatus Falkowbacteria bacterium RIFOXYC12_FULL_34_55]OGF37636.1 MAG: hypothetical protein A2466_01790 [Candidatus Falkowbacteria bacterium RIFOXYC2_FULL_34_220]OGF39283.1 MAG: hypothetical protein A2515_01870 [Candidatus Falkowbacteria bacterium RIFOXYD12_FULL_34_57]OGF41421.1 MAG: hypothetical protein A2531_00035 [Candidatus Falkowbacteria bact
MKKIITIIIFTIIFSGCSLNSNSNKKLTTIEGKFTINNLKAPYGMVNGIIVSGYECEEVPDWCKPPKCKMSTKGCEYANKNVKITGYLEDNDCIPGNQCMKANVIEVKSISIID